MIFVTATARRMANRSKAHSRNAKLLILTLLSVVESLSLIFNKVTFYNKLFHKHEFDT